MNRSQLEHIIRAAGRIVEKQTVIILGSQAILGQFPELDAPLAQLDDDYKTLREQSRQLLLRSNEADVLIPEVEDSSDMIDGAIGEFSLFHHTYGYYAQGVDSTTALLPQGWENRLVLVCNENTDYVRGYCLEAHDLTLSKLAAGREKDLEFFQAACELRIIEESTLLERLLLMPIAESHKEMIRIKITKGFTQ